MNELRAKILIDPMLPSDLPFVAEIERESQPEPWSQNAFAEELGNSRSLSFVARLSPGGSEKFWWAALDDGSRSPGPVVGYICFWVVADELQILNVAVHEAYRRRGVGRELLLRALREGRRHGVKRAFLEARGSNVAARGLYEALGFQKVGERPGYYGRNGEPAVLMELVFEDVYNDR